MNFSSVGEAVPALAGLDYLPPDHTRSIFLGGQNFTHCCLRAANTSLTIQNERLTFSNDSYFEPSVSINDVLNSVEGGIFPCGAQYNGDRNGSPNIIVTYRWCISECNGWEISHPNKLNQWVGPLVQFLLPSLAFCLNIPRTRKLAIPEFVFQAHPRNVIGFTTYWLRLLMAGILMLIDTMVWLSMCFAFAGPMLLSGVYEFVLDRKILEFLSPPAKLHDRPQMPVKLRAQLLLAVVIGNLRINSSSLETQRISASTRQDSYGLYTAKRTQTTDTAHSTITDNTWTRVMTMLNGINGSQMSLQPELGEISLPTKLKSILMAQESFGSTMGAPILFFVGGFIYTVLDIDNQLGDNDQAHALAFGTWWMTIPYLAIVSCAMLSSNSPSALQGIVYDGGDYAAREKHELSFWDQLKDKIKSLPLGKVIGGHFGGYSLIEHTYEGRFQTVTMWNRGPNKRRWVYEAIREYSKDRQISGDEDLITPDNVRKGLSMTLTDKLNIIVGTLFLLLTPSLLAFLVSYNTPRTSLACRTLTYLVYAITQACEMLLWIWEVYLKVQYGPRWTDTKTPAKAINWWAQAFVAFFAVLAAVGGTFMQLLGVYHSCLCRIPIQYWVKPDDPEAWINMSDNTAESIVAAQNYWTVIGSVAVSVLSVVCALCWWHQRRLRKVFREEADRLEESREFQLPLGGSSPSEVVYSPPMSPMTSRV